MEHSEIEKNKLNTDYSKLKKVLLSCTTKEHLKTFRRMQNLFHKKYDNTLRWKYNQSLYTYFSGNIMGIFETIAERLSTVNKLTVK